MRGAVCVAALLAGCHAAPARPVAAPARRAAEMTLETAFIAADIDRARRAGASGPTILGAGVGAAGDSLGGRATLPEGRCALFLSGGSTSVEDVDLFLYDADGSVLASDESPRAAAGVVLCPPHPTTAYVFARLASGHGLYSLSEQEVAPDKADAVARAVGASGGLRQTPIQDGTWPGLDELVGARRRALGGSWRDVRRVAIPMDPRAPTRVSVPVEAGQCLDAVVVPGDEVALVDLTVVDPDGRIVGRDAGNASAPAVAICSRARADLTFEARPHAGRGLAALSISSTGDLAETSAFGQVVQYDPSSGLPLGQAREALDKELTLEGQPEPRVVVTGGSVVGRRESHDLELAPGCSRLDLVLGTPARGIDAWLWSTSGTLLSHASGSGSATLFACSPAHRARLDLEGVSRAGPFAVELRKINDASPELSQHPLAAGRLLHRLWSRGRLHAGRDAGTPAVVSLVPTAIDASDSVVPVGRCLDVALALDAGAEGAELRLLDAETGAELSLERGTYATSGEVCARGPLPAMRLRIEARVGAGSSTALLTRILREVPPRTPSLRSRGIIHEPGSGARPAGPGGAR